MVPQTVEQEGAAVRRVRSFEANPRRRPDQVPEGETAQSRLLRVERMEARFAEGLDLWTGAPLTGRDVVNWLELACGRSETELT